MWRISRRTFSTKHCCESLLAAHSLRWAQQTGGTEKNAPNLENLSNKLHKLNTRLRLLYTVHLVNFQPLLRQLMGWLRSWQLTVPLKNLGQGGTNCLFANATVPWHAGMHSPCPTDARHDQIWTGMEVRASWGWKWSPSPAVSMVTHPKGKRTGILKFWCSLGHIKKVCPGDYVLLLSTL